MKRLNLTGRERGFVILIVLAVIATASVVLATQLGSVQGQQGAKLRVNEEAKARDIAEYCLEIADAYAVSFGNNNDDFDQLLDPNNTIGDADDFVPPATLLSGTTATVSVPPGRSGTHFRYRAFDVVAAGTGATSGTCLIRYDDNNDDQNSLIAASTTSNHTKTEGPNAPNNGVDVPERDRDRTIITTVIGIVPAQSSQANAYTKGHAKATVRRIRAMPNGQALGSAIEAGGTVDFGGSICGSVGGITADRVTGGTCVCGTLNAQLVSGSQGTTAGDCGCPTCASSSGSSTGVGDRTIQPIIVPPFQSLLNNEAFGKVKSDGTFTTGNNIATAAYGAALVYFRNAAGQNAPAGYTPANDTDVFVWDPKDTNTNATLSGFATFAGASAATKNCTDTSGFDPLPNPCKWDLATNTLTCEAGESQCWKLIARLGDSAVSVIDKTGGGAAEQANGAASDAFQPKSGNLPNLKNTGANTARWRDIAPGIGGPSANDLPSCTTCTGGAFVTSSGAGGVNYAVSGTNTLTDVPHMFVIIDSTSGSTTTVGSMDRSQAKISVFSNNAVTIGGGTQCCATCSCPQSCASTTTMTMNANGYGIAVRTNKDCSDSGSYGIIGQVMCRELDMGNSNNNCIVGGLIGLGNPVTDPVTGNGGNLDCELPGAGSDIDAICEHKANFCVKNNFDLVGNLTCSGNICMKNNLNMHGGIIQTQASVGWKNNPVAAGQIRAGVDVLGKNNATITFNGTAGAVENQGVAQAMWMDAAW